MHSRVLAGLTKPVEAVVLGLFSGQEPSAAEPSEVWEAVGRGEFSGKEGDIAEAFPAGFPRCYILGLGDPTQAPGEAFRSAIGEMGRRLAKAKVGAVQFRLHGSEDEAAFGQAIGEVLGTTLFSLGLYKSDRVEDDPLEIEALGEELMRGIRTGVALSESINLARQLAFTPPNIATPKWMAAQAFRVGAEHNLDVKVLEGDSLERERLTGLVTVGKASENPPCFIRIEWNPEKSDEKPVVLVGKTITYDTGGLSIKGKTSMPGMKGDKSGGCAVLGAMHAIATVYKPARRVVALLVAAENSISSNGYRPDDVITFRNGTSVEVTNTDAEGRLVLADGLCWACELENPCAVIDIATLTGGVVVALGDVMAGIFSNSNGLAADLVVTGEHCGDRMWRLPLDPGYVKMMKSEVADVVNSNLNGKAHPAQGAAFLSKFVANGIPWAHLDIAGVAGTSADSGHRKPGPTGWGVRLLADLASNAPREWVCE